MSFLTAPHWEAKTWNKEDEAKAPEKIANVREQASEEFNNIMISSHSSETFASG